MSILKSLSTLAVTTLISFNTFAGTNEELLGYTYDLQGITFQVNSGGCTTKADFTLLQMESWPVQLQLVRERPDMCEAYMPAGTLITYTWSELGVTDHFRFVVVNPMGVGSISPTSLK